MVWGLNLSLVSSTELDVLHPRSGEWCEDEPLPVGGWGESERILTVRRHHSDLIWLFDSLWLFHCGWVSLLVQWQWSSVCFDVYLISLLPDLFLIFFFLQFHGTRKKNWVVHYHAANCHCWTPVRNIYIKKYTVGYCALSVRGPTAYSILD